MRGLFLKLDHGARVLGQFAVCDVGDADSGGEKPKSVGEVCTRGGRAKRFAVPDWELQKITGFSKVCFE